MSEEQELRRDLWLWMHFCLHDGEFIESLRSRYTQEAIDKAIADITGVVFQVYQRLNVSIETIGYLSLSHLKTGVFLCTLPHN
ncbi:MAG TPA: hypothetical protein VIX20_05420 [Ktedonobacteraceae bacterium]